LASKRISTGELVVVSPDVGGVARARAFAKKLNDAPLAIVDKRRSAHNVSEVMNLIGDVRGKVAVLVDDMIDTAGTITNAAKHLRAEGARAVYACATHAVFSPPAVERLSGGVFNEVIVTNTIAMSPDRVFPELTVLSVANLLGALLRGRRLRGGRGAAWGRRGVGPCPRRGRWGQSAAAASGARRVRLAGPLACREPAPTRAPTPPTPTRRPFPAGRRDDLAHPVGGVGAGAAGLSARGARARARRAPQGRPGRGAAAGAPPRRGRSEPRAAPAPARPTPVGALFCPWPQASPAGEPGRAKGGHRGRKERRRHRGPQRPRAHHQARAAAAEQAHPARARRRAGAARPRR
jgi:hypothetical protein